jgi:hypothetical protein
MESHHQYHHCQIQTQATSPTINGSNKATENEAVTTENEQKVDSTKESFIRGLIERGEAVKLKDGKLPLGATHEIVEEKNPDLPTVRRHRFSSF